MIRIFMGLGLWLLASCVLADQKFLYVVDVGTNRQPPQKVMKYDADGSNPEVFINTQLNRPQDIIFLEDQGIAIVSNLGSNKITSYDAESGEYLGDWATNIGQPTRMEIGPDGLLYVLQWAGDGTVLRYDLNGNPQGSFTSVGVSQSIGIAWDTQGDLYVASFNSTLVRRFDSNGNDKGIFIGSNLGGPTNIWFQDDGDMMVLDWNGRSIKEFSSSGAFKRVAVAGPSEPEGVEFLENGDFLVGAGLSSSVRQYTSEGDFVGNLVEPGSGGLRKPNGLRFRTVEGGEPEFEVNAGLNDAWFNAATAGQGAFVTVFPDLGSMFIAVFTYDTGRPPQDVTAILGEPGHRWFTAFGDYTGDSAALDVELTQGGVFDSALPAATQTPGYGTLTVSFSDCENMTLIYDFPDLGLAGEIAMTRIALDNVPSCEALTR